MVIFHVEIKLEKYFFSDVKKEQMSVFESYMTFTVLNTDMVSLVIPNALCLLLIMTLVSIISTETTIYILNKKKKLLKASKQISILSFRLLNLTYICCVFIHIATYVVSVWMREKRSIELLGLEMTLTANVLLFTQLVTNKEALGYLRRKIVQTPPYATIFKERRQHMLPPNNQENEVSGAFQHVARQGNRQVHSDNIFVIDLE